MSEPHTEDREHTSFIKTPKQLAVVVVLAFAIPIILISIIASLVSLSVEPGAGTRVADETIAKRLKPIGEVVIAEGSDAPLVEVSAAGVPAPGAVPGAAPAAATASKGGDAAKGKSVYDATCAVCHAAGIAGAPKAGDKAAWAPRLQQGIGVLHEVSIKGKGAMPAKGGNNALSDADVKAAVDYMVGLVK